MSRRSRSKSKTKTSAEELGFRIVELPRPRDSSPEPSACPSCERPFSELATVHEDIDAGDGHSIMHLERRRGLCPSCGWIDL